jgi:hypothetical protein
LQAQVTPSTTEKQVGAVYGNSARKLGYPHRIADRSSDW